MHTVQLLPINPTVPECKGCNKEYKKDEKFFCKTYPKPEIHWRDNGLGKHCIVASHVKTSIRPEMGKTRVGQQKQKRIKS